MNLIKYLECAERLYWKLTLYNMDKLTAIQIIVTILGFVIGAILGPVIMKIIENNKRYGKK